MNYHGKCVYKFLVEQHIQFHHIGLFVADKFVVQGAVASGFRFKGIEKVIDYLIKWHFVVELYSGRCYILHVQKFPSAILTKLHYASHILVRNHYIRLYYRLLNMVYFLRRRQI